ncbi:zinc-binding alcohol dehydrogenase family protein [Aquimarina intermedia]|uniref:Zinc-binding alcohol dehydrogenase family protein n=2 Tax=Aquimarina intermedia TaxID=350814 RepID=A0A5S5C326_9FLAO|nr:zinc-binding dehydrogenase [Aquimarina intermedia]TYP72826.1 zinc-binding alcohol dehydrogenase family protein [Aquimarina intermedia]
MEHFCSFQYRYRLTMKRQHEILNRIADLLDGGTLRPTLNKTMQDLTVENLKEAHALQESGKAIGKTVIEF